MANRMWVIIHYFCLAFITIHPIIISMWVLLFVLLFCRWILIQWPTGSEWSCITRQYFHFSLYDQQKVSNMIFFPLPGTWLIPWSNRKWVSCHFFSKSCLSSHYQQMVSVTAFFLYLGTLSHHLMTNSLWVTQSHCRHIPFYPMPDSACEWCCAKKC